MILCGAMATFAVVWVIVFYLFAPPKPHWFENLLAKRRKRCKPPEDPLVVAWRKGQCPDCGGTEFYPGPEGGISKNWKCANSECNSRFNVTVAMGNLCWVERI